MGKKKHFPALCLSNIMFCLFFCTQIIIQIVFLHSVGNATGMDKEG